MRVIFIEGLFFLLFRVRWCDLIAILIIHGFISYHSRFIDLLFNFSHLLKFFLVSSISESVHLSWHCIVLWVRARRKTVDVISNKLNLLRSHCFKMLNLTDALLLNLILKSVKLPLEGIFLLICLLKLVTDGFKSPLFILIVFFQLDNFFR